MAHREGSVRLVVQQASERRDRSARHQLTHEHDAAANLAPHVTPDVEAKVHFREGAMPRDWKSEHARVAEMEANHAREQPTGPAIQFDARGYERFEQLWRDLEVEHDEIPPFGAEKSETSGFLTQCGRIDCGAWRPKSEHSATDPYSGSVA